MRPAGLELAEIFRQVGPEYRRDHAGSLNRAQLRAMSAIERCHTAALGQHVERRDSCGHQRSTFNSSHDLHCPRCQSLTRALWLEDRRAELLPVAYFHVVFTVPQPIEAIAYQNKALFYDMLFKATAQTLRTIAADPKHLGAEIGFIAVLHTWDQSLLHHPHLHCVLPSGGISLAGKRWIACRPGFFLPVRVLSRLYRRLFLELLRAAFARMEIKFFNEMAPLQDAQAFEQFLTSAASAQWVIYAKAPFGGPEQVLEYLGHYAHRVAIANSRLVDFSDSSVAFRWKDNRREGKPKVMRLLAAEFTRRFLLHVLPSGLQRIRHHALLANRTRDAKLQRCRELLGVEPPPPAEHDPDQGYLDRYLRLTGVSLVDCPACKQGRMACIETLLPRPPAQGPPDGRT